MDGGLERGEFDIIKLKLRFSVHICNKIRQRLNRMDDFKIIILIATIPVILKPVKISGKYSSVVMGVPEITVYL